MKSIKEKLEVLTAVAKEFDESDITWAIGASSMLYLRNIVGKFNDLDLMIKKEDALKVKEILLKMGTLKESVSGSYAQNTFMSF